MPHTCKFDRRETNSARREASSPPPKAALRRHAPEPTQSRAHAAKLPRLGTTLPPDNVASLDLAGRWPADLVDRWPAEATGKRQYLPDG
jgi:hypothetical protein